MATTASNFIQGAATIWAAPFGTTEPTTAIATPGVGWVDLGGTLDGVEFAISTEWNQLQADQIIDAPESRQTGREVTFSTNLAEPTLENLKVALNGGTVVSAAGTKTYELASASSGAPTYQAIMIDGWAPSGKRRRIIARKVLNTGDVESAYKKDEQTVYSVEFRAHFINDATKMVIWMDEVAV